MPEQIRITKNVSGLGFNQVDPKHGLTRGRVMEISRKLDDGRVYVVTDAGEEVWLKPSEHEVLE